MNFMMQLRNSTVDRNSIRGFSLVELMIAMTLGLVLTSSMIAVFLGNKRTSEVNTAMANIQENARFALDSIARDARVSGFQGCIDINSEQLSVRSNNAPVTSGGLRATSAHASIINSDGSWTPASPIGFTPSTTFPQVAGTHALTLQFGDQRIANLDEPMMISGTVIPSNALPIQLSRPMSELGLRVGDIAIISNCDVGDLFTVTAGSADSTLAHAATGGDDSNASPNLTVAYGLNDTLTQTSVMRLNTNVYYIGDTGQTNANGDVITALYRQTWPFEASNPPTELIEGVEDLRVSFGIRSNNDTLSYLPPDAAGFNPSNIESLQVGILMNSFDRVSQDNDRSTYELAGQPVYSGTKYPSASSVHAGDRRFRLAFNTTIKIRNRR